MRVVLIGQIRKNNKNAKAGLAPHPHVRACVSMVNKGAYRADQLTRGQERLRITPTPFHTEEHMEHLIDGDFASNNGGWGFSASTGVDPQPYFRIFNPLLQSEKFDKDGEYIRKWIPELNEVEGTAIHDPYGRGKGSEAKKAGYMRCHRWCRH